MDQAEKTLAESVGKRVLREGGARVLEFCYLLQEKNALETLRAIALLSDNDKIELLNFMRIANSKDESRLVVSDSCLSIQCEATV
jgi:hypothetical protein